MDVVTEKNYLKIDVNPVLFIQKLIVHLINMRSYSYFKFNLRFLYTLYPCYI